MERHERTGSGIKERRKLLRTKLRFKQTGLGLWCTGHDSTNKPLIAV